MRRSIMGKKRTENPQFKFRDIFKCSNGPSVTVSSFTPNTVAPVSDHWLRKFGTFIFRHR